MTTFRLLIPAVLALVLTACQGTSGAAREAMAAPQAAQATATPAPTPTPTPKALTLVTMGASDVAGVGADDPKTQGWAPVLAKTLPGQPTHVRLGVPGWTAAQIRANALDKAVKARPDVVVLWTGVNDFNGGVSLEAFKADLDPMLAALAKTEAKVYVLNMPDLHRLPAFKAGATMIQLAMPVWRTAIQGVAQRHGATVVELTPYSDEIAAHPEYISADGFHPSTRGYQRLAEIVQSALKPAVLTN
ncbi:MAG: SGNH/GDSL hydrolase family protein [Candidatus Sericytochromatia bacterium]